MTRTEQDKDQLAGRLLRRSQQDIRIYSGIGGFIGLMIGALSVGFIGNCRENRLQNDLAPARVYSVDVNKEIAKIRYPNAASCRVFANFSLREPQSLIAKLTTQHSLGYLTQFGNEDGRKDAVVVDHEGSRKIFIDGNDGTYVSFLSYLDSKYAHRSGGFNEEVRQVNERVDAFLKGMGEVK